MKRGMSFFCFLFVILAIQHNHRRSIYAMLCYAMYVCTRTSKHAYTYIYVYQRVEVKQKKATVKKKKLKTKEAGLYI